MGRGIGAFGSAADEGRMFSGELKLSGCQIQAAQLAEIPLSQLAELCEEL